MAGYVKGITIEFGANTQKLNKALSNLQTKLNKTQTELRQVNTALKFNPRNATLLKQKFDLLQQSVQQTEKKLKGLRAMQARMDSKNIDKNSQQYRELQREIIKTENNLKSAEKALRRFGTVGKQQIAAVGQKMKQLGTSMISVGRTGSMYLTAPLTMLGTMAGRTTADFDEAMSKVQAISGATGNQLDALRDKAREMGANTKFSATESAEALTYMAMAGWKTKDMLAGLEGIMNLAAASGEDLATTSDIVTDALTAFGLSAEDSAHFADILAAASSNANTNVSMMGETFKYAAPIAGALGYSAEDTAQAIGLMANAGIKGSQAGTSLRNIMTKLSHDFVISGKNIGEVTIATTNADGSMRSLNDILADSRAAFAGLTESEKAATAESLVGRNAMSGFLALMNASPKDIGKLQSAIENADGAAENMAATMMDNFGGQLTILKSQLSEAAIAIGDTLVPFMKRLVSIVQTLVDKFNALSPTQKRVVVVLGMVAAALPPLIMLIGGVVTALGMASIAFGALDVAMLPIIGICAAVAAGIALLVAVGVILYKNWSKITTAISQLWNKLKTNVTNAVKVIKTTVTTNFNSLKNGVTNTFNSIKNAITSRINSAKTAVSNAIQKIKGFFPLKIGKIFSGIKLPSFDVKGGKAPYGLFGKGVKPSISVSWNKKAMNNPYLFNNATLFGAGEAGDEVLYGRSNLMKDIAQAVGGASLNGVTINVYGTDNMDVNDLAQAVERRIITMQKRRSQAWA